MLVRARWRFDARASRTLNRIRRHARGSRYRSDGWRRRNRDARRCEWRRQDNTGEDNWPAAGRKRTNPVRREADRGSVAAWSDFHYLDESHPTSRAISKALNWTQERASTRRVIFAAPRLEASQESA